MSKFPGLDIPVDRPSRMIIRHPKTKQPLQTADGEPGWIDLLSPDSLVVRDYNDELINKNVQRRMNGDPIQTAQMQREDELGRLALMTVGWRLVSLDGNLIEDPPFSHKNARELYAVGETNWLREQVEAHVVTRANFMKPPSES